METDPTQSAAHKSGLVRNTAQLAKEEHSDMQVVASSAASMGSDSGWRRWGVCGKRLVVEMR